MRAYALGLLLLGGCSIPTRQITVIKSESEIKIKQVVLNEGDVLVCDPTTCKVVTK